MRAITGTIVSSRPLSLRTARKILNRFAHSAASHVPSSDYAAYLRAAADAAREHYQFLRLLGAYSQHGSAHLDADGYEGLVDGEAERRGGEENGGTEVPTGGPHISAKEVEVEVGADEKKSKKRKMKEDPHHEDKAVAGVASHIPRSAEITSEQRKKKEKHSSKELACVVKQEPDLVVEEELGGERKKKLKHTHKELASNVKQGPDLVVEEESGREKKGKKKKERDHVKLEEDVGELKGQVVNNGVAEQGIADREKKRKKKEHSEEGAYSKGVKEEEKAATDAELYSEKKKKKRGRGDDDGNVQDQGEHKKKKQRNESRD